MEKQSDKFYEATNVLIQLQFRLNPNICNKIWKGGLGIHMWEKFTRLDRNLLVWLNSMDTYTRKTLFRNLKTVINDQEN